MKNKTVLQIGYEGDISNTLILNGEVTIAASPSYDIYNNLTEVVDDQIVHSYELLWKDMHKWTICVNYKNKLENIKNIKIVNLTEVADEIMKYLKNHIDNDLEENISKIFNNENITLNDICRANYDYYPYKIKYSKSYIHDIVFKNTDKDCSFDNLYDAIT